MWRKLAVILFLLILAQTANASSFSTVPHDSEHYSHHIQTSKIEKQQASIFNNDDSQDLFNLPRLNRHSASLFSAELQTSPNYVLVIEFFKRHFKASLFKNLANPPIQVNWFEQLAHKTTSSRISGWKDGNYLYTSRIYYHS